MKESIKYWKPGEEFNSSIYDLFDEKLIKNHLVGCIKHYLLLADSDQIPKEITLPEGTLLDKTKKFTFNLDSDEIHLIEVEYRSNRITGSWIEILLGVGTLRENETTGFSIEKFLARLKFNSIESELISSPYDYELYFSFPNLHEELQVWQ